MTGVGGWCKGVGRLSLVVSIFALVGSGCESASETDAGPLVGTWRSPDGLVLTFRADGTFTSATDNPEDAVQSGTYELRDGHLTTENDIDTPRGKGHAKAVLPIYLTSDQIAYPAYRPIGSHQGAVGEWTSTNYFETVVAGVPLNFSTLSMATFRANSTMTWSRQTSGGEVSDLEYDYFAMPETTPPSYRLVYGGFPETAWTLMDTDVLTPLVLTRVRTPTPTN